MAILLFFKIHFGKIRVIWQKNNNKVELYKTKMWKVYYFNNKYMFIYTRLYKTMMASVLQISASVQLYYFFQFAYDPPVL